VVLGRKLYEDELDSRMAQLGLSSDGKESTRTQELRYWRKKVGMEEEAAVKQAGMLLSLLSSFVESFTTAVGFTTIRTQGLSEAIQTALEAGDFDLAIKSYCVSPDALEMLKNPAMSFMTSFGHIVLRTHIDNVKRELTQGIEKFNLSSSSGGSDHKSPHAKTASDILHAQNPTRTALTFKTPPAPSLVESFRAQLSTFSPVFQAVHSAVTNSTPASVESRPGQIQFA